MSQSLNDALRTIRERVTPQEAGERYGLTFSSDHKKALCPWHGDHDPSLCFYKKSREAKYKCHVCGKGGSCIDLTMQLLGLSDPMEAARRLNDDFKIGADLGIGEVHKANPNARRPRETSSGAGAPPSPKGEGPAAPEKPKREIKWDYDHPTAIYPYTDENGEQIFEVLRLEGVDENGKRDKTFRQRHVKDGKLIWKLPEGADSIIYRLPQVLAAIRDGRPVWIAEGEKDVGTLESWGLTGTTKAAGAQPWSSGQLERLRGADVVILHDCDDAAHQYKGEAYAWQLATALTPIAKRVRLVNLFAAWPEVPPKGDITDMAEALGSREALQRIQRQLAMTRTFDPAGVPFWLPPVERITEYYKRIPGYEIRDGCICQSTQDGPKMLANFCALPRQIVTVDNGATQAKFFKIDAWADGGRRKLTPATIPAGQFDSMGWLTDTWDYDASLTPGNATKDKVRWTLKEIGRMAADRYTQYSHTGWRRIDGQWAYLYPGGAIGLDGVTVDLAFDKSENMGRYGFDGGPGINSISTTDAARASWRIRSLAKREISVPSLAMMYLAPLREFFNQIGMPPSFALFFKGTTGSYKSTFAELCLSHFGDFNVRTPPANFMDTYNNAMAKAFMLKDFPLLVDDYHPVQSAQQKRQMQSMASWLVRAVGDGAARGRMNADGTLQTNKPPRCVTIMTGEDNPLSRDTGGMARMFIVSVEKGDICVDPNEDGISESARQLALDTQESIDMAHAGYLRKAMRGYIEWLQPQAAVLPKWCRERFRYYRNEAQRRGSGEHARTAESIAHLMCGYELMLQYFCGKVKLLSADECQAAISEAMAALCHSGEEQSVEMHEERPARIFLRVLGDLLASGAVKVKDLGLSEPEDKKPIGMVGWVDRRCYYFLPEPAYGAVCDHCRRSGDEFPVSLRALYQSLQREKVVPDGRPTATKYADGKNNRCIWIPRQMIDGSQEEKDRQQQMELEDIRQNGEIVPF